MKGDICVHAWGSALLCGCLVTGRAWPPSPSILQKDMKDAEGEKIVWSKTQAQCDPCVAGARPLSPNPSST
jgi:hypothetical protein